MSREIGFGKGQDFLIFVRPSSETYVHLNFYKIRYSFVCEPNSSLILDSFVLPEVKDFSKLKTVAS